MTRIVLYAEGVGETGSGLPLRPGEPIPREHYGPGHILVARSIEKIHNVPLNALRFESPLRTVTGRIARGSDLHHRESLRRLLTWAQPSVRPHAAVVLVDRNDEAQRKHRLSRYVEGLPGNIVISVATKEFEAWLISDQEAVTNVLCAPLPQIGLPQNLRAGEAKRLLAEWCRDHVPGRDQRTIRVNIANTIRISELERRSRSYNGFLRELGDVRFG